MEIAENLRLTLDKTLEIAMGLQSINFMIYPNPRIGARGKQRIQNISKQVHLLNQRMKTRQKKQLKLSRQQLPKRPSSEVVRDSPTIKTTQFLSKALQQTNQRVRLSKAGHQTIGKLIQQQNQGPSLLNTSNQINLNKKKEILLTKQKNLPFVDSRTGQVEDPVSLPTFQQYLKASGADYMNQNAKHDLFKRIEKAQEQISRLQDQLDINMQNYKPKQFQRRKGIIFSRKEPQQNLLRRTPLHNRKRSSTDEKVDNIRSLMNSYFRSTPKYSRAESTPKNLDEQFVEAEESLEESLRSFYRSKLLHKEKFEDIIEKVNWNRPFVVKAKVNLIERDKGKFKNQFQSVNRFEEYKRKVQLQQKQKKLVNHQQGLGYLCVLDYLIKNKIKPTQDQLCFLGIWKKMVQTSRVINQKDFNKIATSLDKDEKTNKLIQKFSPYVFNFEKQN